MSIATEEGYGPRAGERPRLRLWPESYAVATVRHPPALPGASPGEAPVAVVVEEGETTVVAPAAKLKSMGVEVSRRRDGYRLLTLAGELPLEAVGVVAALSRALTEARVSVLVVSSFATDHLLVPEKQLGRALAALAQVRVPGYPQPAAEGSGGAPPAD